MTLQDIADDLEQKIDNSSSASKTEILTVIAELVDTLIESAGPNPKDEEIVALQKQIGSLNAILNNYAATVDAIKLALGNPNLTQGQLANEIQTNWRRI